LVEQAPAMAQILRELVAGVLAEHLRGRAEQVLERIDTGRVRESGEDDEYDNMQEEPIDVFFYGLFVDQQIA
jgi:hypothetical protein